MKQLLIIFAAIAFASTAISQTKKELKQQFKQQKAFLKKSEFSFIPAGSFVMGGSTSETEAFGPGQTRSRVVEVNSFYMMQFEVSNFEYQEYVTTLKAQDSVQAKLMLPDTLVWRQPNSNNEKYTEYYFRHPAYHQFPVVGVSYNQAIAYSKWMTEQYNTQPEDEKEFKKVKFRLPTEEEWEFAARGGLQLSSFPWGGPYMQNAEGDRLANMQYMAQSSIYLDTVWVFDAATANDTTPSYRPTVKYISTGPSYYMGVAGQLNEVADVTAPVKSFNPNGYGLYNMTGNVEEMVDAYYFRDSTLYTFSHDLTEKQTDDPSGVTKGGSWDDTGYYGMINTRQFYDGRDFSSREMGFRLVMDVVEY